MALSIASRRYLGNKASIAPWIVERTVHHLGHWPRSILDVFAGTGSVAWAFNRPDTHVLANDLLYSNYVCLEAWLGTKSWRRSDVERWIEELNHRRADDENYVSEAFGDRYWSRDVARRIGAVREAIETLPATPAERCVLLAALLYAADRVANTCGHYDAWRRRSEESRTGLELRVPDIDPAANVGNQVFCQDGNRLGAAVEAEVAYIDPPYNSRQYSDTYHVLENLARWEKPPLFGVARKMDRRELKSRYCTIEAEAAFSELVESLQTRLIVVSYNNMGTRGDPRSNARISDETIRRVLARRGPVVVEDRDFRAFTTGKRFLDGHQERLFICRTG
ncbi:MAG TPA: DNA adenine methylase [Candidatus Xenobia bacterium]|jgi:adenine-specific DNA-methyltransferase